MAQSHSECRKLLSSGTGVADSCSRTSVHLYNRSADCTVSVVKKLRTGQSKIRIPKMARNSPVLQNSQTISGPHPISYSISTGVLSPRPQRTGRKAECSPPSCSEIENEWSHTSNPPIQLHDVAGTTLAYCIL